MAILVKKRRKVPQFTRVHRLFRIRTVTNAVSKLNRKGEDATSLKIADVLARTHLSKMSFQKKRDRIGRRARDHLSDACYLGLLSRKKKGPRMVYWPTPHGELLNQYKFTDECPKDVAEKSVFLDRVLRLKLTNIYDYRNTYRGFRSRPILFLLTLLSYQPLSLFQLYYAMGEKTSDPALSPEVFKAITKSMASYKSFKNKAINTFLEDYGLGRREIKDAKRSVKPLLDWCEDLGLIFSEELGVRKERWYYITELGLMMQKHYSNLYPIWFQNLEDSPIEKASILITYLVCRELDVPIGSSFLDKTIEHNLYKGNVRTLVEDLQHSFNIFDGKLHRISQVDFDFYYDIPPLFRDSVTKLVESNLEKIGLKVDDPLRFLSMTNVNRIKDRLSGMVQERTISQIGRVLDISIPRPELFRVPFEWTSCFILRVLGYNAVKYQGMFSEHYADNIAQNNPDIVIFNDFTSLVECKSSAEWGTVLTYSKQIKGEILAYQAYVEEIKAESAIFACEGKFGERRFIKPVIVDLRKRTPNIVLTTQRFLANAMKNTELKTKFDACIRRPTEFEPDDRIFR